MKRRRPVEAVFVEPFMGGSHAAFARGWIARSRHRWRVVSLPAERWKWRLRASALVLGPRLARLDPPPDVVVATSLCDLAHLRERSGLAADVPFLLYLHENQLDYPRPAGEPLERGFAIAHIASLLAADGLAVNSRSHRDALEHALDGFLGEMPASNRPRGVAVRVRRARVLPPGVDLAGFPQPAARPVGEPPVIVWNHRWEEDKRPSAFARIVLHLADRGRDFRLVLLGPVEQIRPRPLELLRERAPERILHVGPATTRAEYVAWLARSDIAISMAAHENFGYSVVEALAAGAVPLLPRRLSYPEILPAALRGPLLYGTDRELLSRLTTWLLAPESFLGLRAPAMRAARRHEWTPRAAALDDWVQDSVF